jgi:hypothetical protein
VPAILIFLQSLLSPPAFDAAKPATVSRVPHGSGLLLWLSSPSDVQSSVILAPKRSNAVDVNSMIVDSRRDAHSSSRCTAPRFTGTGRTKVKGRRNCQLP